MEYLSIERVSLFLKAHRHPLISTHAKLCYPIIDRIYRKMLRGIIFPDIKVDGDLIIDGHHRYLASMLAGRSLSTTPYAKSAATTVCEWEKVVLVKDDWDTAAKIYMLNEQDAKYNNIEIEEIIKCLNKLYICSHVSLFRHRRRNGAC